jgi:cell division protein FtsI (penicillin-binding protein 3)
VTTARATSTKPTGARIQKRRLRLPVKGAPRRIAAATLIYVLLLTLMGGRLVQIQVIDRDTYADRSIAQRNVTIDLPARRGRVYDRDGAVLASSVDSATIFADPRAFKPHELPTGPSFLRPATRPRWPARSRHCSGATPT